MISWKEIQKYSVERDILRAMLEPLSWKALLTTDSSDFPEGQWSKKEILFRFQKLLDRLGIRKKVPVSYTKKNIYILVHDIRQMHFYVSTSNRMWSPKLLTMAALTEKYPVDVCGIICDFLWPYKHEWCSDCYESPCECEHEVFHHLACTCRICRTGKNRQK